MKRWVLCLAAVAALSVPAFAAPQVKVVYRGACVVVDGIKTPMGKPVKAWDMWQEIFQTGAPTWLQAHTHHGAECITNVSGVTSWWFAHATSPSSAPTTIPAGNHLTVYTVQGRVHTAGNVGPATQSYLGIHLLQQGSAFNYPTMDPSAPPVVSTALHSVFKSEFQNQVPSNGTLTIVNEMIAFEPGGVYGINASQALGYYTAISGTAKLTMGGTTVAMVVNKTYAAGRGVPVTFTASTATMIAATELVPGSHPTH
ncbi:MAG: hypothetical protein JO225_02265 [Candidatus Eremiobacteraeota bacterium]|nr:hypothetical protein [Candidatus Eremiobacteraeota bacterium]